MDKLILILLSLLSYFGTAQEVKTKYFNAKGKEVSKPEVAVNIVTEKFDDKGDLYSYEIHKHGELVTAMYFEEGLPTGNWISDGRVVNRMILLPMNCEECTENLNTTYNPESIKLLTMQLMKNIRYPEYAIINDIQGRIIIRCKIDENKNIVSFCLTKKGHPVLNMEALRVITSLNINELLPDLNSNCLIIPVDFKLN